MTKLDKLKATLADREKIGEYVPVSVDQPELRALIAAVEALKLLHDNIAEYARINNLGGFDNQDMQMARAALAPFGE